MAICHFSAAQDKVLDHPDFAIWNRIQNASVSDNGAFVGYQLTPGEGSPTSVIYSVANNKNIKFDRASKLKFTSDSRFAILVVEADADSVKEMRRGGTKKEQLPTDTLVIVNLDNMSLERIPDVQEFRIPDRWSEVIAYTLREPVEMADDDDDESEMEEETEEEAKEKPKAGKKFNKKNGYRLIVRTLGTGSQDTLDYVTDFTVAHGGSAVAAISKGRDSTLAEGVYVFSAKHKWRAATTEKGDYKQLSLSESGQHLAFVGDTDTTDALVRPFSVYLMSHGDDSARVFAAATDNVVPDNWIISEHGNLRFSRNEKKLYYGVAPTPVLQDTSLLDEEIVNVEVWHYMDERLYTQQSVRADREKKRNYTVVSDLGTGKKTMLSDQSMPEVTLNRDANSNFVVRYNESPYLREMSWSGMTRRDVELVDTETGESRPIAQATDGRPRVSPGNKYVYWYSRLDSAWHIQSTDGSFEWNSKGIETAFYNELNDSPNYPWGYGNAGWTKGDTHFLIYDRYDIWRIDLSGVTAPQNLTKGRSAKMRHRYIPLDDEQLFISTDEPLLIHMFDETSKGSGYGNLDLVSGSLSTLVFGDYSYETSPMKARNGNSMVFTYASFTKFPDLNLTYDNFATSIRITDANPQQSDYRWGTTEIFKWTAYDGKELEGVLVKPDDYDPSKKYPVIVNFYERSSDRLHSHRAPYPGRSTINYSFYVSRGYVIFNPDVVYDIGYPGKSAYNCVVSGTEALIEAGIADPEKIGVQGHSWGGYQIADLITRTDIFACAESGAPVVNMVSAYGGIRWQTGLSRMFQYEHTQSRLGASLWEGKELYLENSPIFNLDKVNTPVLIMHNDKDGHVPWYQGIEFFVAMRRLGKPAWMLNYNGEPHWPLKLQNRKDFNVRLQQFFDHYLMDEPMPVWMESGVPAIYKGIESGYEFSDQRD